MRSETPERNSAVGQLGVSLAELVYDLLGGVAFLYRFTLAALLSTLATAGGSGRRDMPKTGFLPIPAFPVSAVGWEASRNGRMPFHFSIEPPSRAHTSLSVFLRNIMPLCPI